MDPGEGGADCISLLLSDRGLVEEGLAGRRRGGGPFACRQCRQQLWQIFTPSVYLRETCDTFSEKSNQLLEVELVFLERLATTGTPGAITRKVGYYTA